MRTKATIVALSLVLGAAFVAPAGAQDKLDRTVLPIHEPAAKSITTLDARGAVLVGKVLHDLLRAEIQKRGLNIAALGGLTMGADPISLAVAMASSIAGDTPPIQAFVVRKEPKGHGRGKRIEGNFSSE